MHHKTRSLITITFIIFFMFSIALVINNTETPTGAFVSESCECSSDSDCEDYNPCTEDFCLYPDSCKASLCVNKKIEDCR